MTDNMNILKRRIMSFMTAAAVAFAGIGAMPETVIKSPFVIAASANGDPEGTVHTIWDNGDEYLDAEGQRQSIPNTCTEITSTNLPTTWGAASTEKWYNVDSAVTVGERITVSGTVNLILCDNATLTASKGINVSEGNTLNIYAQSTGNSMGQLYAGTDGIEKTCDDFAAGIGGGIGESVGIIKINGGNITVNGDSAGIGGGDDGTGGNITITGGKVTATSVNGWGAGIGSGYKGAGGTITITGGEVTATGSNSSASIGGGYEGTGGTITISGGTVKANEDGTGYIGGEQATVTLGWTKTTDSIKAEHYDGTVSFASGKRFIIANGDLAAADNINRETLTPCTYKATFKDGEKKLYEKGAPAGTNKIARPADPKKTDYLFTGWYLENAQTAFDFTTAIEADITLFANWLIDSTGGESITSGTCGENINWKVEKTGGKVTVGEEERDAYKLTITGTGAMTDNLLGDSSPWFGYRNVITSAEIGDGVTSIGSYAFYL